MRGRNGVSWGQRIRSWRKTLTERKAKPKGGLVSSDLDSISLTTLSDIFLRPMSLLPRKNERLTFLYTQTYAEYKKNLGNESIAHLIDRRAKIQAAIDEVLVAGQSMSLDDGISYTRGNVSRLYDMERT